MVTIEAIVNERNLLAACGQVLRNEGAPDIDGVRTEELFSYLVQHWQELQLSVMSGTYRPEAVRGEKCPSRTVV